MPTFYADFVTIDVLYLEAHRLIHFLPIEVQKPRSQWEVAPHSSFSNMGL